MAAEISRRTVERLSAYLDDICFPCTRQEILRSAEDNEAPDMLLDVIERLPEHNYSSVAEVMLRIGGSGQTVSST